MRLQFLAIPLLVALMLSPLAAAAATGSITFSSPASGAPLSGQAIYTISGTISPTPTLPDNVFISVNQVGSSNVLDAQTVSVTGTGTFSYATNAGGNSAWVTGTYVITATDSNGATGTTTFSYTSTITPPPSTGGYLTVVAPSQVLTGATSTNVFVWTSSPATVTGWFLAPGATTTTSLGSATRVPSANVGGLDVYAFSVTLPATAATGVYLVGATATNGTFAASNIGSFTVNPVATQSMLTTLTTNLATLTTNLATLQTGLTTLTGSVTTIGSGVTGLQTSITSIGTGVTGLQTSMTALSSSVAGVGKNLTTWGNTLNTAITGISGSLATISNYAQTAATAATSASTAVASLQNSVNTLSTSISSITGSLTTLQGEVTSLQTSVNGLTGISANVATLQTNVSNMNSTVSNDQTYILVVAALAVITLVLELAILIRKLS
jgi:peptidoglycan hydrolase CwlO-like protein